MLIRSGEARLVGWSRQMLYSGFSILPRSVIRSANSIDRSDNLDVIRLEPIAVQRDGGTMIFAKLNYKGEYSAKHRLLVKQLAAEFADVEDGLQGDSWIGINENGEKVSVDSFTSMQHEVKAANKNSALAPRVIKVLERFYNVTVHVPPQPEAHE